MNKTRMIPPLRFLRRFQNGSLGVLVISLNPETGALAIFKGGACELWECSPGIPPKCVCDTEENEPPIDVALQFATHMLSEAPGNPIGGPNE